MFAFSKDVMEKLPGLKLMTPHRLTHRVTMTSSGYPTRHWTLVRRTAQVRTWIVCTWRTRRNLAIASSKPLT